MGAGDPSDPECLAVQSTAFFAEEASPEWPPLLYLRFVLFQPVEGCQASPSTSPWLRPRPCRSSSLLWLRFVLFQPVESEGLCFVLLQPLEGCQPLTFVDWESTLETSEIREPTLETLEILDLERA